MKRRVQIKSITVEITGRCNMRCLHCRSFNPGVDLSVSDIGKSIKFANMFGGKFSVNISEGEPLLHPKIKNILELLKNKGIKKVRLLTNGSLINKKFIAELKKINIKEFVFIISLDSTSSRDHDYFRGFRGSFRKTIESIGIIKQNSDYKIFLRPSLSPMGIENINKIYEFFYELGTDGIIFSDIHPVGKAKNNPGLLLSKDEKRKLLIKIRSLIIKNKKRSIKEFKIYINDPLLCLIKKKKQKITGLNEYFCNAGVEKFAVNSNGNIIPCLLLNLPISNIKDYSLKRIKKDYMNSDVIVNLLKRNFKGKCKTCKNISVCGGCRGRAMGIYGDYLDEDPHCWL